MTKPAQSQYKTQRQEVQKQMDALEQQIEDAEAAGEDTTALEEQLAQLKQQRDSFHDQWKQERAAARGQKGGGKSGEHGKANAPGQMKKGGGTTG